MAASPKRLCVAQIGAPHGVRGEVRLWTFTQDPQAIKRYGALESEDGTRSFDIVSMRPAKDHLVARLRGVDDRDAAERLTNTKLFVSRDRLPATEDDDTFYHADLIGLSAAGADGTEIGTIVAVFDFGAGDIIEIMPAGGGAPFMLPFTKAAVPVVDFATGRVVIEMPSEVEAREEDARDEHKRGA
jgi:16S rRNA processing protein RimM